MSRNRPASFIRSSSWRTCPMGRSIERDVLLQNGAIGYELPVRGAGVGTHAFVADAGRPGFYASVDDSSSLSQAQVEISEGFPRDEGAGLDDRLRLALAPGQS